MFKIIWSSTKEVFFETEDETAFYDFLDDFAEHEPYDIEVDGYTAIIDNGDPYEE